MKKDYYEILGFTESEKTLQGEEFDKLLKKKYRKLCLKWHPDKFSSKSESERKEAEDKFKEITEANAILSDTEKRRQYDLFGTVDGSNGGYSSDFNMDDLFRRFAEESGFGGGFNPFGHQRTSEQRVSRGADKEVRINVTLEELYNGGTKNVTFNIKQPCSQCNGSGLGSQGKVVACPHCNGTGYETITHRSAMGFVRESHPCSHCGGTGKKVINGCSHCNGTGIEDKKVTMNVNIPFITDCGKRFVKRGAGNAGEHNGINGDLYVSYNVTNEDKTFYLEEDNVFTLVKEVEVNLIDCLLGADINIKHINGKDIKYRINECTDNEDFYVIANEGLPMPNGGRGDLKIVIKCKMPNKLSKDDIKVLSKLKKSDNFK